MDIFSNETTSYSKGFFVLPHFFRILYFEFHILPKIQVKFTTYLLHLLLVYKVVETNSTNKRGTSFELSQTLGIQQRYLRFWLMFSKVLLP